MVVLMESDLATCNFRVSLRPSELAVRDILQGGRLMNSLTDLVYWYRSFLREGRFFNLLLSLRAVEPATIALRLNVLPG